MYESVTSAMATIAPQSFVPLPAAARVAKVLRARKQRIAVVEATTAGLIAAQLVSQPGASAFFISDMVVYTGRGAKLLLPPSALSASGLFDRERNYKHRDPYIESKKLFCDQVARAVKTQARADWVIVESGTSGPEFYIPGVEEGFTAVGVIDPQGRVVVKVVHSGSKDRVTNMNAFVAFALDLLCTCVESQEAAKL